MRHLILFRHAKSCWTDPDLDDHDRPLTRRGRLAAPLMGAWLSDEGLSPDHVICSSSARTRETWERARIALPGAPEPEIAPPLYHADPRTMLDLLRAAPDAARVVAMVGHQPGVGVFARKMANGQTPAGCARAFQKFPTAACAVLDIAEDAWSKAAFGQARFSRFAAPRELI
jgi:phosphohistidine phosphatase